MERGGGGKVSLHFRTDAIKTHGARSDGLDFSGYQGEWNIFLHVVHWEIQLTRDPLASLSSITVRKREAEGYNGSISIDFTSTNTTTEILGCLVASKPHNSST